jgi:iron complex outermembrane receptor protein
VLIGVLVNPVYAQSVLEEVIVTAQKREQTIQEIPSAITAYGAEDLANLGVDDIYDIRGIAPNVEVVRIIDITTAYIRGVGSKFLGSGADGSVAFHTDGVYVPRPRTQAASFYDIERIEILRGPQGTLYGRNATGGSINIITRKPTEELDGFAKLTFGNYERINFEGAIGGSLTHNNTLLGRLSVVSLNHEGYGENVFTGNDIDDQEEYGARLQLQWVPTEDFDVLLIADAYRAHDAAGGWHVLGPGKEGVPITGVLLGGSLPPDPRDIAMETDPERSHRIYGFSGIATWRIDDQWTFKSLSGYREGTTNLFTDIDGVELFLGPLKENETGDSFSQELQLQFSNDRLDALLGAYYFTESIDGDVDIPFRLLEVLGTCQPPINSCDDLHLGIIPVPFPPGTLFSPDALLDTDAWAVFFNADYRLTDRLLLTAGIRYNYEKRKLDGTFTAPTPFAPTVIPHGGSESWDDWTPKLGLSYNFTDNVMAYVTWSEGFKSGTFVTNPNPAVEPEELTAYEAGIKALTWNGRLQANVAGFIYDFKNLQVNRIVGALVITENASDAEINGIEAEFAALLGETVEARLNLAWLDATYKDFSAVDPARLELGELDLSGNDMTAAPEYSVHAALAKRFNLANGSTVTLSGHYTWRDDQFYEPFNQPNAFQEAYGEFGARLSWLSTDRKLEVAAWGRNLDDETAIVNNVISTDVFGFPRLAALNEPRTYGIDILYRF